MVSKLIITTGDVDGVGWEITAKALQALGPQKHTAFYYFRQGRSGPRAPSKFKVQKVATLAEAEALTPNTRALVEIQSANPPAVWVEEAATRCLQGAFAGLVTAPLSKTSIVAAGFKDIGHTEILARVAKVKNLHMGFIGDKFSVVLATGHEPLAESLRSLSKDRLNAAIDAALALRSILPPARRKRPLALVGLNPHAGENGLLGREEDWFRQLLQERAGEVAGPLVPDAAFLPGNWSKYSVYISPYHDQGLIPFKLVHGFKKGVHLTLGLPFVRTSVDHGTAKDIFGRNRAESGSMQDALKAAMRLKRGEKRS